MSFTATWMDLEIAILSEVNQGRNILWHSLYVESKNKLYKWTYWQNKNRQTENEFMVPSGGNGEGNSTPLQYSCLENPMDGGPWWAAVHGVAKSRTRLSDFTFTFHFHASEKEMATHSSVLAWRIPGTEEPGGLLSMGLHRVGHDWSDSVVVVVVGEMGRMDS